MSFQFLLFRCKVLLMIKQRWPKVDRGCHFFFTHASAVKKKLIMGCEDVL